MLSRLQQHKILIADVAKRRPHLHQVLKYIVTACSCSRFKNASLMKLLPPMVDSKKMYYDSETALYYKSEHTHTIINCDCVFTHFDDRPEKVNYDEVNAFRQKF